LDGRKNNKGTKGNKGGRKSKSEEQQLIERLTPMADVAHEQLKKALDSGEQWAVKLWFEYFYGKPRQSMDLTTKGDKLAQLNVTVDSSETAETLKKLRDGAKAD
jgi:hypothetical protein